jgi:hypothetical protein
MGVGSVSLKCSDVISPSVFCHCDAAQQHTLAEAEARH